VKEKTLGEESRAHAQWTQLWKGGKGGGRGEGRGLKGSGRRSKRILIWPEEKDKREDFNCPGNKKSQQVKKRKEVEGKPTKSERKKSQKREREKKVLVDLVTPFRSSKLGK